MKMQFGTFDEFYDAAILAQNAGAKGLLWISEIPKIYDFGFESSGDSGQNIDVLLVTDIGDFNFRGKYEPVFNKHFPDDIDKLGHLKETFNHKMVSRIVRNENADQTVRIKF